MMKNIGWLPLSFPEHYFLYITIKAEYFYKESINLDNKIPEPYNNLGNLYRILGKENLAIELTGTGIMSIKSGGKSWK